MPSSILEWLILIAAAVAFAWILINTLAGTPIC